MILLVILLGLVYFFAKIQIAKKTISQTKTQTPKSPPVAQIANSQLEVLADGTVEDSTQGGLVQLFLPQEASKSAGGKITETTSTFAIKLAGVLKKSDYRLASIRIIDPNNIAVYDTQETVAIFTSAKKAEEEVDALQLVIAKARTTDGKIAKIDLRFDKPVVTYK